MNRPLTTFEFNDLKEAFNNYLDMRETGVLAESSKLDVIAEYLLKDTSNLGRSLYLTFAAQEVTIEISHRYFRDIKHGTR